MVPRPSQQRGADPEQQGHCRQRRESGRRRQVRGLHDDNVVHQQPALRRNFRRPIKRPPEARPPTWRPPAASPARAAPAGAACGFHATRAAATRPPAKKPRSRSALAAPTAGHMCAISLWSRSANGRFHRSALATPIRPEPPSSVRARTCRSGSAALPRRHPACRCRWSPADRRSDREAIPD